jgi:hypothetical protein
MASYKTYLWDHNIVLIINCQASEQTKIKLARSAYLLRIVGYDRDEILPGAIPFIEKKGRDAAI